MLLSSALLRIQRVHVTNRAVAGAPAAGCSANGTCYERFAGECARKQRPQGGVGAGSQKERNCPGTWRRTALILTADFQAGRSNKHYCLASLAVNIPSTSHHPMNKLASLSLALCATATVATAQTPDSTTYKHHIGLTASPVLDGFFKNNRSLPLGLLYKRQIRPNQAVRVRVVGQYSRRDTTHYFGVLPGSNNRYWELQAYAGYEWQRLVSRRVGLYYGTEVGGGYSRRSSRDVRRGSDSSGTYQYDALRVTEQWQAEARPFVGVQVALGRRISAFAESVVNVTYVRYQQDYNGTGTRTYPNGITVPTGAVGALITSDTWQMRWRPVQLIGMSIRF